MKMNWRFKGVLSFPSCSGRPLRFSALLLATIASLVGLQAQSNYATPYTFTTLAGLPATGITDGTGTAASFNYPQATAVDAAGNVYVADTRNCTIRKITSAGVVTTFAGLAGSSGSTDGQGSAARFGFPKGIAVDGSGNVYVADQYNYTIRKINPLGVVTTLAGTAGSQGWADATGSAARFGFPAAVTVDVAGNVYVADGNNTIRKITSTGVVTTLAGLANSSGSADGIGSAALFQSPSGIAVDGSGNVYVADKVNYTIRKITSGGVVTTIAGTVGSNGWTDGTGNSARFGFIEGLALDTAGNLYAADSSNSTIRKITPGAVVTTFAGFAPALSGSIDGTGNTARFDNPSGVSVDSSGNLYVADMGNHQIRKITPAAVVSTFAGTKGSSGATDGTGSAARLKSPNGVAVDSVGNIYVVDSANYTIRKITSTGIVTTLAGSAGSSGSIDATGTAAKFTRPNCVAVDGAGNAYVTDNYTVRKITSAGVVTTLAGLAGTSGATDGTGTAARFEGLNGVAVDGAGNVYVADGGSMLRKITPAGVVTTLAGATGNSGSNDGIGSAAQFSYLLGVAVDSSGNIFVADEYNCTIRKITSAGVVTTFAGSAGMFGYDDGTGSAAKFVLPVGVAVDGADNIFVTDYNKMIRKITPGGVVTTIAGDGNSGSADGAGDAVRFNNVSMGIAADAAGNVYVADTGNNTIRKGVPYVAVITNQPVSQVVTVGGAVTFSVATTGATAPTFQWRKNGFDIAGATGSSYTIASVGAGDAAQYTVVVNVSGGADISVPVTLSLNYPPTITTQPVNHEVVIGYPVTFSALATGTPTPTYQWRFNGAIIAGATGSSYSIASISASDAGNYSVVATNSVSTTISNSAVLTVDTPMAFTTLAGQAGSAGSTDATGTAARFSGPYGIAVDAAGSLYVADALTIRKITTGGVVTTLAGSAGLSGSNDGTGSAARFASPTGLTVNAAGVVFVADTYNFKIRSVSSGGLVGTFAGSGTFGFADGSSFMTAQFSGPQGVAVDGSGNVYVADTFNDTIRKISGGMVTTFAGSPGQVGSTDGTGSAARFLQPKGVAVDAAGNVYVADTGNNLIRKITPAGEVTTLAGLGLPGAIYYGSADGVGTAASFSNPTSLAVDGSGNVYVVDSGNNTIRKITGAGVVTTLAGLPGGVGSADGVGSVVRFNAPQGIAVDGAGNLYVADSGNSTIRKGTLAVSPLITSQPSSQTVTAGNAVTFTASASGVPAPTYQWLKGSVAISGATNASLAIGSAVVADAGAYTVVASNGLSSVTSNVATLTVTKATATVTLGGLSVVYDGAAHVASASTSPALLTVIFTYNGSATAPTNAGTYSVIGTVNDVNYQGTASGNLVIAKAAPVINWPAPADIIVGTALSGTQLNASANVAGAFVYNPASGTIPAVGTLTLNTTFSPTDSGNYSNASAQQSLMVNQVAPVFSTQPAAQIVNPGQRAVYSVVASGSPAPTYRWQIKIAGSGSWSDLTNGGSYSGVTTTSMQISNATLAMTDDQFRCVATNSAGAVNSNAGLLTVTTATIAPSDATISIAVE